MKKVIIIGPAYPFRGGLAAFNQRLARAFAEKGDEVDVVTYTLQYPSFLFPGQTQYSESPPPEDLKVERMINSLNPFNWIKTGLALRKKKADLVIVAYWLPYMSPAHSVVSRLLKKTSRVISIAHNIIPHEKNPGDKLLTRLFINSVHGFIIMSRSVQEDLKRMSNKPAFFHPHPLYDHYGPIISKKEARAKLGFEQDMNYLLFFGFIRYYKGLDLLLKAFGSSRFKNYPLKLIIAGEYYESPQLYQRIIDHYNLSERIEMHDHFIPDEKVADYFNAADLVVQPYRSATQSGVSQIAYHFNKPIVVTNQGGLGEWVIQEKTGYVVEPKPKDIANAIESFLKVEDKDAFARTIESFKQKFSWNNMVDLIDDLYKKSDKR